MNAKPVIVSTAATLLTLYALEAITLVSPASWVDKLGTTLRKGPSVVSETFRMRQRGARAYPFLQPDTFVDSARSGLKTDSGAVIPLSGIPDALTILCNESGTTIGYRSDELGFRNPQHQWESTGPEVVLIGDSFAHGFCRSEDETIAGMLRRQGIRVVNAGLTGTGPLAQLGVLREYVSPIKPLHVFWLFYEGNDLIDLVSERETKLAGYLDSSFTQNLRARSAGIATIEKAYADSVLHSYRAPGFVSKARGFITLRNLRTATGLYRGVRQPRARDESNEVVLLRKILTEANREAAGWGGQLHLVYLPERRRFDTRTRPVTGENHSPVKVERDVLSIAKELNIPVVNAATAFARDAQPSSLWNARRYHYNTKGYALIADLIEQALRAQRETSSSTGTGRK